MNAYFCNENSSKIVTRTHVETHTRAHILYIYTSVRKLSLGIVGVLSFTRFLTNSLPKWVEAYSKTIRCFLWVITFSCHSYEIICDQILNHFRLLSNRKTMKRNITNDSKIMIKFDKFSDTEMVP